MGQVLLNDAIALCFYLGLETDERRCLTFAGAAARQKRRAALSLDLLD